MITNILYLYASRSCNGCTTSQLKTEDVKTKPPTRIMVELQCGCSLLLFVSRGSRVKWCRCVICLRGEIAAWCGRLWFKVNRAYTHYVRPKQCYVLVIWKYIYMKYMNVVCVLCLQQWLWFFFIYIVSVRFARMCVRMRLLRYVINQNSNDNLIGKKGCPILIFIVINQKVQY